MPSLILETPETYDSITRPVTTEVVKDLIERLSLPNDTGILYQGNAEVSAQRGSILARKRDDVTFPFTGRVKVDLTENYLEANVLNTATLSKENPPVFADPALGVSIHPVYTRTEAVISFSYRAPDFNTATRWRDHIRRKSSEGMQALLHELHYHYSPPEPFLTLLHEIYQKREAVEGYGDSYNDYLINHFTHRLTTLANMNASRVLGAIAEKQIEVQGWLSFPDQPDVPDKDREGGTWNVDFTYTFHYDKVTAMTMFYPIVVHNQLLDERFIDTRLPYTTNPPKPRLTSRSASAFDMFRLNHDHLTRKGVEPVVIPFYDDWKPVVARTRTLDMITCLVGVDYDDPFLIVDLKELGDIGIEPDVLEVLKEGHDLINQHLMFPFFFTFYRGKIAVPADEIMIDENLVVRSRRRLNPRDIHHFKFSVVWDLTLLGDRGRDIILRHPSVAKKIIILINSYFNPSVAGGNTLPSTGNVSYPRQPGMRNPIHPGFTTGGNPFIKPRPGQTVPGQDGTIQPGGVGGRHPRPGYGPPTVGGAGQRNPGNGNNPPNGQRPGGGYPGDTYQGSPDEWLVVIGDKVTKVSWDKVIDAIINNANGNRRGGLVAMQTVMRAGIIAHRKQ